MSDIGAVKKLLSNTETEFEEAKRILLKIANNIIENPHNENVRCLQKANATISKKIVGVKGAVDYLKLMGFQESNQSLSLPLSENLDKVIAARNALNNLKWVKNSEVKIDDNEKFKIIKSPSPTIISTNEFLKNIEIHFHNAQIYDNQYLQQRAKSLIPINVLELKAINALRAIQKKIKLKEISDSNITLQDLLILELLAWFKNDFFSWVDSPKCEHCDGGKTKFLQMSNNAEDFQYTNRVELHKCEKCEKITKFPRYNDLNILLETRRGRCGEWANTFTLMCRSMGWDTRHVIDEEDHVWTEVYSIGQKRWLHCDPCENACDTPLMYEIGWKKPLTYVIAYSGEEVQDVTWRYSCNHKEILKRRKKCSEQELVNCLVKLREKRQKNLSASRRDYLTKRLLMELVELMSEKIPLEDEYQGRLSGSLDWRQNRGETSEEALIYWEINEENLVEKLITLQYSTTLDQYKFSFNGNEERTIEGWKSGVYSYRNIFRKVEQDWKVSYLARTEGSTEGSISWEIRSTSTTKVFDIVNLKFVQQVYENGIVNVTISSGDLVLSLNDDQQILDTDMFSGKNILKITVKLKGGKGNVAWQHAQIFRQSLNNEDFPFILKLQFKDVE